MVCPDGEAVTYPPRQEREQRGKIPAANPARQTAAASRSNIERLRAEDSPRAHPLLSRGSRVPDKADMGRSHKKWPLPVIDWVDSGGRSEILP